jgi:hypothetical protein
MAEARKHWQTCKKTLNPEKKIIDATRTSFRREAVAVCVCESRESAADINA